MYKALDFFDNKNAPLTVDLVVKRIALGLRRMDKKPDYLLFFSHLSPDWVYDEEFCYGIKVIHSGLVISNSMLESYNCPFIPVFNNKTDDTLVISDFIKGYDDGY